MLMHFMITPIRIKLLHARRSGIRVELQEPKFELAGQISVKILIKGKEISSSKRGIRGIHELTE